MESSFKRENSHPSDANGKEHSAGKMEDRRRKHKFKEQRIEASDQPSRTSPRGGGSQEQGQRRSGSWEQLMQRQGMARSSLGLCMEPSTVGKSQAWMGFGGRSAEGRGVGRMHF